MCEPRSPAREGLDFSASLANPPGDPRFRDGRTRMKVKIALVGNEATGKTGILRAGAVDEFDDRYVRTIGVKVLKKTLVLSNGEMIDLDVLVYDILGIESLGERLCSRFLHGTKGILAVCDGERPETVTSLDGWIRAVRRVAGDVPAVVLVSTQGAHGPTTPEAAALPRPVEASRAQWFHTSRDDRVAVEHALDALGRRILHRSRGVPS